MSLVGSASSDAVFVLGYLFTGSTEIPFPGPPGNDCGSDTDEIESEQDLGCEDCSACAGPS